MRLRRATVASWPIGLVHCMSSSRPARDPEVIARIATETNVAPIAGARTTARRALLVAREAVASVEPVTEQLALVDGQLVQMRSEIANLSEQGTTQAAELSRVSDGLDSLRLSHEERLESLIRQVAAHETRVDFQGQEAKSTKTWTRAAAVGAAFGIGIAVSHALDHSGR